MLGALPEDFDQLTKSGQIVVAREPRPSPPGTEGLKSPYLGPFNLLSLRAFLGGKTILGPSSGRHNSRDGRVVRSP